MGTPQELFERPEHTFVGYFIGSPGMNLLPATVKGSSAQIAGSQIALDKGYAPLGGKVELGVRPEFVRVSAGGEGIPARIARVEDVGRHKIVRLDVNGQSISAIVGEETALPSDGAVVQFDPEGINIYENDWRVAPQGEAA